MSTLTTLLDSISWLSFRNAINTNFSTLNTDKMEKADNLSGLTDLATARSNLWLWTLATQSGTFSGTSSGNNTWDQNIFSTVAVSGQSNVVADSTSDTITFVAWSWMTITTDATTDTITFVATPTVTFIWAKAIWASTFTLTNNTENTIEFASEEYDTDTIHNNSTNNSRMTCKTAWYYTILWWFKDWPTNWDNTKSNILYIYKNGSEVARTSFFSSENVIWVWWTISVDLNLSVNDYVELVIRPNLYVSSFSFTADSKTFLSMKKN